MDWSSLFPDYVVEDEPLEQKAATHDAPADAPALQPVKPRRLSRDVEVADIGCGFGGLLVALALALPETLILGE